jgi:3-deoxy-D-manno-octulosonic-acid transferase
MARSLALALHLLTAAGGEADAAPREPRPEGTVIWFHVGASESLAALAPVARRLSGLRKGLRVVVTGPATPAEPAGAAAGAAAGMTAGTADGRDAQGPGLPGAIADPGPGTTVAGMRAFLSHWRPDAILLSGAGLPAVAVAEAAARGIPMVAVNLRPAIGFGPRAIWQRALARALLPRLGRIMVADSADADQLSLIARGQATIDVSGRIEDTPDPLPCNEAEREALATLIRSRPVWLAMAGPATEDEAVFAAHAAALRLAHRMLMILVPDDSARVPEIAALCRAQGWTVALRARDEEPLPEVEVLIADGDSELGLWYRLAPVTYMGGTLSGTVPGRSPLEAAALGSAVIAGPSQRGHAAAYARLTEGRALRLVRNAASLGEALGDLIAPDRAALLAHNAWIATSGGAEVADRVAEALAALIDRRRGAGAPKATPAPADGAA